MKNKAYNTEDGVVWNSRSIAVVGMVFADEEDEMYVLANKRGQGTPDFQGYWNMPCGYLDYDETLRQAVSREVHEESGILIHPDTFDFIGYDDNSKSNLQNVTMRFSCILSSRKSLSTYALNSRGGEADEVEAVSWISVDDIDNYEWAFGHKELIKEQISNIING